MQFSLEPIALISRPKLAVLRHVGVLLPDGRVAHCAPTRGEHVSGVEEFAAGEDVTIERTIASEQHSLTLQRIAAAMAAPGMYNLASNNCEMFANRVVGEKAQSPQLVAILVLAAVVAVIVVAASS
jgi:hypothetical protein